jgi:sulfate adenylyltransferase
MILRGRPRERRRARAAILIRRVHYPDRAQRTYNPLVKIKILCTLGPASLNRSVIDGLDARGVDLYRINLSHTATEDIGPSIELVRRHSTTPICLDSEGPQVRCGAVQGDVLVEQGSRITLTARKVPGSRHQITLWPRSVFDVLQPGSMVSIDFDGALLRVVDMEGTDAQAEVVRPGRIRSNKAVTVDTALELPSLSEKDLLALEIGARHDISHYALSFATRAEDVGRLRSLAPAGAHVIAKIESRAGIRAMDGIIEVADSVLIDRGDLSREVPLEQVPYYQKAIVRRANRWNRPVYVATNLLESMVTSLVPTIAEANDLANTLLDGVHGLVLAAETAIGRDPVGALDIVRRAIEAFDRANDTRLLEDLAAPITAAV